MNLKQGEVYICTEPCCKAEIVVRRGADFACPGNFNVRCCCGKEMVREDKLQYAEPARKVKKEMVREDKHQYAEPTRKAKSA